MVTALPPPPPPRTDRRRRESHGKRGRRTPLVAALLGLAVVAAAGVALVLTARHENPPAAAGTGGGSVTLRGVTAYDPDGSGPPGENNSARSACHRRRPGDVLVDRELQLARLRQPQAGRRARARRRAAR